MVKNLMADERDEVWVEEELISRFKIEKSAHDVERMFALHRPLGIYTWDFHFPCLLLQDLGSFGRVFLRTRGLLSISTCSLSSQTK